MKRMPENITPMRPTSAREPFTDLHYVFEVALEGIRTIAYVTNGAVKLQSEKLKNITGKYPQIVSALQRWHFNAVVDGVIVALTNEGVSDPNGLKDEDTPLYYFVFDLLWYNGKDYMTKDLYVRKNALKRLLYPSHVIIYNNEIKTHGLALYRHAQGIGAEGIVAKRINSIYRPGARSKDWVHIPVRVPAKKTSVKK